MHSPGIEPFRSVGLIAKYGDPSVCDRLHELAAYLRAKRLTVYLDDGNPELARRCTQLEAVDRHTLAERSDLVIVVGGDGTLLGAARSLAPQRVPILGINLGRLGFLTDVSPERMTETLDRVLAGQFLEERRFLLRATLIRDGNQIGTAEAVNEIVVHKWNVARMIECEVSIDGRFLYTMRADGLIVSTPTGSTAYALSGGGPILHPALPALVLVPICPHTMTNRPLVVGDCSRVEVRVCDTSQDRAQVTADGQINLGLVAGDRVVIERSHTLHLIHPADHDYYRILREKLHWGKKLS